MEEYKIEVEDRKINHETVRVLLVNGKEQSVSYINSKKNELIYQYNIDIVKIMKENDSSNTLLIGGGGFSIPKYYISHFKEGNMDVIEKNEEIYDIAKRDFFLSELVDEYQTDKNGRLKVYVVDAKEYLKKTDKKYNIIVNDAYDGGEMVTELLTEESIKIISNHLVNGGLYIINLFSALTGYKRKIWNEEEQLLSKYFSKTSIKQVDLSLPKEHRQNCIVVAKK